MSGMKRGRKPIGEGVQRCSFTLRKEDRDNLKEISATLGVSASEALRGMITMAVNFRHGLPIQKYLKANRE